MLDTHLRMPPAEAFGEGCGIYGWALAGRQEGKEELQLVQNAAARAALRDEVLGQDLRPKCVSPIKNLQSNIGQGRSWLLTGQTQ